MTPARILVVEDDRVVARDLRQQLVRLGYEVAGTTPRGEEAAALAMSARADLALCDIRLEGHMDGIDAAGEIRAACDIPVVFLTAYADDETLQRARITEPLGYLLKPFEDSQLRTAVEMALYRHRADRRLRDAQAELARVSGLMAMGELAASIAHEINQPLAAIVTNASAGLNWLRRPAPELGEVEQVLARIQADATRAADVIRGLQALARKSGPELARLDLHAAIREVIELIRTELQRRGVRMKIGPLDGSCWVLGDRVQVQQVLVNLLRNGIDAICEDDDPVRLLEIRTSNRTQGEVTVEVIDSGGGIAEEHRDRLFDAFFTTRRNGMGMGLAICRSIVEAHHGRLWAEAHLPRGTRLVFVLPEAPA